VVRHGNNAEKNVRNRPYVCNISLLTVNSVSHQCISLSAPRILVNLGAAAHGALGLQLNAITVIDVTAKGKLFIH
jgi:hypothetical protein